MAALRENNVVHHVYNTKGQPDDEIIITDSFYLKFKSGASQLEVDHYLATHNLEIVTRIEPLLLLVRVTDATGVNPIRAANRAAEHEHVEYAEPNLVHQLTRFALLPDDPFFNAQWHLFAPANGTDLVMGADVNTPEASDITTGSRDIVICVADDGIDVTHPDFIGADKIVAPMNIRAVGGALEMDGNVMPRAGDYHGTP